MTAATICWNERNALFSRARRSLRRRWLGLRRQVLGTEDARALLAGCFQGLESPYTEVGKEPGERPWPARSGPVFITARFRSGSTLLWNLFRHVPGITAYYEPLNERRWFDPAARGEQVDPTHRQVTNYWKEYEDLEILGRYYHEDWIWHDLLMGPGHRDDDLKRYIEILIDRAPGRPVLQFNRVDFRLPWLRYHFPAARIVHLYRHPRDQWLSSLGGKSFPLHGSMADFAAWDGFYLGTWGRDLKNHFPFLDERSIAHPYELFYYIWKLSFAYGRRYADYSIAFEHLMHSPQTELERLLTFLGIDDFDMERLELLVEKPAAGKWRRYAEEVWFRRREAACDAVLEEFFGAETIKHGGVVLAACAR